MNLESDGHGTAKRLGLLHELLPSAARFAVLVNRGVSPSIELLIREVELYKNREGHCEVPQGYKENGFNLGNWVNTLDLALNRTDSSCIAISTNSPPG